jgi:hypothetical protein
MIWRNAFLDLVNNLSSLVGTFGFEIVTFGFSGLIYHKLRKSQIDSDIEV